MGGGPRLLLLALFTVQVALGVVLQTGEAAKRGPDLPAKAEKPKGGAVVTLTPAPAATGSRKVVGPRVPPGRSPAPPPPLGPPPLEVRVVAEGPDAALAAETSFRLRIRVAGTDRVPWILHDEVEVRAGELRRFPALPAGRVEVALVHRPWSGISRPSGKALRPRLDWPRPVVVLLPTRAAVVLPVRVARVGRARVVVAYPPGARPGPGEVLLWPRDAVLGAEPLRLPLPRPTGDRAVRPVTALPGDYEVLVRVTGDGPGWTAAGHLVVGTGAGETVHLNAAPARRVEGLVRDPAGRPVNGAEIQVTVVPWRRNGRSAVPWEVEADEGGRFSLGGLPHGDLLRFTPLADPRERVEVLRTP